MHFCRSVYVRVHDLGGVDRALAEARRDLGVIGVDPVRSSFVASLNQPGANVTGTSIGASLNLHAQRLQILNELVPTANTFAALLDPNVVETEATVTEMEHAAHALRLRVLIVKAGTESVFDTAFLNMKTSACGTNATLATRAVSACDRYDLAIEADSNLLGIAIAQAIIEAYQAGAGASLTKIKAPKQPRKWRVGVAF